MKGKKLSNYIKLSNEDTADARSELGDLASRYYFKQDLFYTQGIILQTILDPTLSRICIITPTRYGKSWTLAQGALILAGVKGQKVMIVGATKDKAQIIMNKIIDLIQTAHEAIKLGLVGGTTLERLRISISKEGLGWNNGGKIFIASISESLKNTGVSGSGVIGYGADTILVDESAMISDRNFSVISRILVEHDNTKIVEISNPHQKNHFYKRLLDSETFAIWIDIDSAVTEGRMTRKQVELASKDMTNRDKQVYLECEFVEDTDNTLFSAKKLDNSIIDPLQPLVPTYLGVDVALEGNDKAVACIISKCNNSWYISDLITIPIEKIGKETIQLADKILQIMLVNSIGYSNVWIDGVGNGSGVIDELEYRGYKVNSFKSGSVKEVKTDIKNNKIYDNIRSEALYTLSTELGTNIFISSELNDLDKLINDLSAHNLEITDKIIKVESKSEIKKRLGKSPDYSDAVKMAFWGWLEKNKRNAKVNIGSILW